MQGIGNSLDAYAHKLHLSIDRNPLVTLVTLSCPLQTSPQPGEELVDLARSLREYLPEIESRLENKSAGVRKSKDNREIDLSVPMKIAAALAVHHAYETGGNGSCLNFQPATIRQLVKSSSTSNGSVSKFLQKEFGGTKQYKTACQTKGRLITILRHLMGDNPPRECFNPLQYEVAE